MSNYLRKLIFIQNLNYEKFITTTYFHDNWF